MVARHILGVIVTVYLVWLTILIVIGLGLGSLLFLPGYLFAVPLFIIIDRIRTDRPLTPFWVLSGGLCLALMVGVAGIPLWDLIANAHR
jgi:NhaP-type Na+/H+ and K+/H+ antiporter